MVVILAAVAAAHAEAFAMREVLGVDVRDPLGLHWSTATTTVLSRVEWVDDAGAITWTSRPCAIATTPVFGATTTYSDAFVTMSPVRTRAGRVDALRFTSGPIAESLGDGDDDRDGEPGVTVHIAHPLAGEGDVWVRQRAITSWTGTAANGGWTGTIAWEPTQTVYGASTWWLEMSLHQRPTADPGTFEMRPIAGDCPAVLAAFADVP